VVGRSVWISGSVFVILGRFSNPCALCTVIALKGSAVIFLDQTILNYYHNSRILVLFLGCQRIVSLEGDY